MGTDAVRINALGVSTSSGRYRHDARYSIITPEKLNTDVKSNIRLLTVYDGRVLQGIKNPALACIEAGCQNEGHKGCRLTGFLTQSSDFKHGDYEQSLRDAFSEEERTFREEDLVGARTTVALCLIDLAKGTITVADEGDSHVAIAQQQDKLGGMYGVTLLSRIHKSGTRRRSEDARKESRRGLQVIQEGKTSNTDAESEERPRQDQYSFSDSSQHHERTTSGWSRNSMSRHGSSSSSSQSAASTPPTPSKQSSSSRTSGLPLHTYTADLTQSKKSILLLASDGVGPPQEAKDLCEWATIQYEGKGWGLDKIANEATNKIQSGDCTVIVALIEKNERDGYFS